MKRAIVFLAFMSTTGVVGAENLPTQASNTTASGSNGSTTTIETRSPSRPKSTSRLPMTAEFKADLAYCRSLAAEERRSCERETYAARAEGLYR